MKHFTFCPDCATPLQWMDMLEDGGYKKRNRCPACGFTHWNNPTPVLAAVITYQNKILLARNAAWPGRMFALVTGFMEAGESPEEGIAREIAEETNLAAGELSLIGAYEFKRMNQLIVAYHAVCDGDVKLSPELAEYKLFEPEKVVCWQAGTGLALAKHLQSLGHTPQFMDR